MSILIKGMKMPTSCDECPLQHTEYLECKITGADTWEWVDEDTTETKHPKPEDCPLIEINPHGRLIDADALKAVICEALKKALDDDSVNLFGAVLAEFIARGFTDEIENAPTIIEAEGVSE